jgi:hypothetical protein
MKKIKTKNTFTISKKSFRFLDLYALFFSLMIVPAIGIYCLQALNTMTAIQVQADYRKPAIEKVKEPTMQEWVMGEIRKAGLSEYEAWAIVNAESRWNPDAVNVNNNKTWDGGLWQINSVHKIPNACKFDYRCATKWAIEKRLHDTNWGAWYGAKAQGIK